MIGNIIYRLMEHPDQFKLLKEDSSLVENTVEESLRYDAMLLCGGGMMLSVAADLPPGPLIGVLCVGLLLFKRS